MTAQNHGYQEPSGIYYSETEPMRFLRLINFANSQIITTNHLLALSGINQFSPTSNPNGYLSSSAFRFKYYHYDEWNSKLSSLSSGNQNVASGILDWMRSEEPLVWYYYDQGPSGNFTRKITKNVSYPFDDITTIDSGDTPLNTTFPVINSQYSRISDSAAILLPFYQTVGLIKQVQNAYDNMFAAPITNTVHPLSTTISGVPVPQIDKTTALQLNNLNLKPTDFIGEYASPLLDSSGNIIFPLNIAPGSGFQPILDMAQQINYPREYISNLNAILPYSLSSPNQPVTDCNNPSPYVPDGGAIIGYSKADRLQSQIYFGFMIPSSLNISMIATMPTYGFTGTETTRMGNTRADLSATAIPTINVEFHSIGGGESFGGLTDNTIFSLSSQLLNGNYSFNLTTSGNNYTIAVTGAIIQGVSNALGGYNSFSRYYDPLADANSDNNDSININTINFYMKFFTGWAIQFNDPKFCNYTSNAYFNAPYLSLSPSNFDYNINGIDIPTTKYSSAQITNINAPTQISSPNGPCWPIIGKYNATNYSTVTINYTIPAINCHGYSYRGGRACSNPGAHGTYFCSKPDNTGFYRTVCDYEKFYRASKFVQCCHIQNFIGECTNSNNDTWPECDFNPPRYSDCYIGNVPPSIPFRVKNSCGRLLFSTTLPTSLPDEYNVWKDVQMSVTLNVGGVGNLNDWQGLYGEIDLTTEYNCISLLVGRGITWVEDCINDFRNDGDWVKFQTCESSEKSIGYYAECWKDLPAGQIIPISASTTYQSGCTLNSCRLSYVSGPAGVPLWDSDRLAIEYMINKGGLCGAPIQPQYTCRDNTTTTINTCCIKSTYLSSFEGKIVNIQSVNFNLGVRCPDGSISFSNFDLGGGSFAYPNVVGDYGCGGNFPTQTFQFGGGNAPGVCGAWW